MIILGVISFSVARAPKLRRRHYRDRLPPNIPDHMNRWAGSDNGILELVSLLIDHST